MPPIDPKTRTCGRCHAPEGVKVFRRYSNRFQWTADWKEVSRDPDFAIATRTVQLREVDGVLLCGVCREAAGRFK